MVMAVEVGMEVDVTVMMMLIMLVGEGVAVAPFSRFLDSYDNMGGEAANAAVVVREIMRRG